MKAVFSVLLMLSGALQAQNLSQFSQTCDAKIGATIPAINCLNGQVINVGTKAGNTCDKPANLNGLCHDYGRIGRIPSNNPDVEMVYLCRHYKPASGPNDPIFQDVAIIQHNYANGQTCFYQNKSPGNVDVDGRNVPAPKNGEGSFWSTPAATAGMTCVRCHDNGPFIRTPFVNQSGKLPQRWSHYYAFPGDDFASWKTFSVTTKAQNRCTSCHTMGVSNIGNEGSSLQIGPRSAGLVGTPGLRAGIADWMAPDHYAGYRNDTTAIKNCAAKFKANNFSDANCVFTQRTGLAGGTTGPTTGGDTKIKLCNKSGFSPIFTAIGFWKDGTWHSHGWFKVENGDCASRDLGHYSGDIYVYAEYKGGDRVWKGPAGAPTFCINKTQVFQYTKADSMNCPDATSKRVIMSRFHNVRPGTNTWTFNP